MTDWNLGNKDEPVGDLLTDVLNHGNGHLVASSAYSALHSNDDDVDLLEAGDKNSEPADEASRDVSCGTGVDASSHDDDDLPSDGIVACHDPQQEHAYSPWLDASGFHRWTAIDPQKKVVTSRSEVLAVARGKSVVRGSVVNRKHHQFHDGVRVRGRLCDTR